jgi:hypothetical protein
LFSNFLPNLFFGTKILTTYFQLEFCLHSAIQT